MNHEWLSAFVAFADRLNFTQAAKHLHISQPALHVQIQKLTEQVGVKLYQRRGRSLFLTAEGHRLAAFGRESQDRDRSALEEIRGQSTSGPVVLTSGQGAFLYLLGPAIRRFPKDKWPLRLLSASGPEAIERVRESKSHLAVAALETSPSDLIATPLRTVSQSVIVPLSHRLARRKSVKPIDLNGEKLVVAPEGSPHRVVLQQLLRAAGCEISIAVEATGWELMLHFAKYGVGITVVNDFCPAPRDMVALPLIGAPPIDYFLLHKRGLLSKGAEVMQKLLIEHISLR